MADRVPDVIVLRCKGVPEETGLAFGGLSQLLEPIRGKCPALLRRALGQEPGDDLAARTAVLEILRLLARQRPVLVIVDDAHAVDSASMAALRFAERRITDEPIGIVLNGEHGPLDEDDHGSTDEALAEALDRQAAEAATRGGMAATVSVLRQAARLSADDQGRARRLSAAAHAAWKTGDPGLACRLLDTMTAVVPEPIARPLVSRLRGLVELYSGDQASAQENLTAAANEFAISDPGHAARLLFLAIDAAHHRDRLDDVLGLACRIRSLDCEPGFHVLADLLVQAVSGTAGPMPDPWRILDAVPDTLTEQHAHRWLVTMAISRRGPHPRAAREFGLVAAQRLRAHGILALYAVLLPWLADLEVKLGRWDDARAHAEEALRAAIGTAQAATATDARACLARIAALTDDAAACRDHAEFVLRQAPAHHNLLATAQARWAIGVLHLSRGEYDLAAERLEALGHSDVAVDALTDTVEALLYSGRRDRAAELLANAAEVPPACAALVAVDAEAHFRLALSTPDNALQPFERARCELRYGQWLRRERRIGEAKVRLRAALETFESLGAAEWAKLAAGELRAAGSSAATGTPHALTAQERQVAELAASGLSNREIGARLFLSPRTVGYHLYKLFPKLGVASRAQLRDVALSRPA